MFLLTGLFYLVGFLVLFGAFMVLIWWLRWVVVVSYVAIPVMGVIYGLYAFLFALPINIMFDGSPFEKRVVVFSHAFSGLLWDIFCFACLAPFKAIGLIIDILNWCVK